MTHLSRMAEELVLWSSVEFRFVRLGDDYATGSSIMPQKRNPDAAELVRGKSARVCGDLHALLSLVRALPLAYNRDLQEDREPLFDAVETTLASVRITAGMWRTLTVARERFEADLAGDFSLATELADLLAERGVAFREAHEVVGRIVRWCEEQGSGLEALTPAVAQRFHARFPPDLGPWLDPRAAAERRTSAGGTAWSEVEKQMRALRADAAPRCEGVRMNRYRSRLPRATPLLVPMLCWSLWTGCATSRDGSSVSTSAAPTAETPSAVPSSPADPTPAAGCPLCVDPSSPKIRQAYAAALADARYPRPSAISRELTALLPSTEGLVWNDRGQILMVSWTRTRYFSDPALHRPGERFSLAVDMWLFAAPFVQQLCQALGLDGPMLTLRLEQADRPAAQPRQGRFRRDLGRPWRSLPPVSRSGDLGPRVLGRDPGQGPRLPASVGLHAQAAGVGKYVTVHPGHLRWMCDNWADSYGNDELFENNPWTALGYTYDWGNPEDHRGPSEYVAPRGSRGRLPRSRVHRAVLFEVGSSVTSRGQKSNSRVRIVERARQSSAPAPSSRDHSRILVISSSSSPRDSRKSWCASGVRRSNSTCQRHMSSSLSPVARKMATQPSLSRDRVSRRATSFSSNPTIICCWRRSLRISWLRLCSRLPSSSVAVLWPEESTRATSFRGKPAWR